MIRCYIKETLDMRDRDGIEQSECLCIPSTSILPRRRSGDFTVPAFLIPFLGLGTSRNCSADLDYEASASLSGPNYTACKLYQKNPTFPGLESKWAKWTEMLRKELTLRGRCSKIYGDAAIFVFAKADNFQNGRQIIES